MPFTDQPGARTSMTLAEWTPELSLGIEILDDDHKVFFGAARWLHYAVETSSFDMLGIEATLAVLHDYAIGHFRREEAFLIKGPQAEFVAHKREHDDFRERLTQAAAAIRDGDSDAVSGLAELVCNWVTHHIGKTDCAYRAWVTEADIDKRPLRMIIDSNNGRP